MKIIRIDRETIKKNPNAGSTQSHMQGLREVTFKIESDNIPEWFHKDPFYPTEWEIGKMKGLISGAITDEMIEKFKGVKGLSVDIKCNPITIEHTPAPDYFYDYEQTTLKCKHCKNKIAVDEIECDWILDEYEVEICPICKQENTFPKYKYERIEDVLK